MGQLDVLLDPPVVFAIISSRPTQITFTTLNIDAGRVSGAYMQKLKPVKAGVSKTEAQR